MSSEDKCASEPQSKIPDPLASLDEEIRAELEFYLAQPEGWKKDLQGKYAVIKNQQVHRVFDSRDDAYAFALEKFGNTKFLIQQIGAEQTINYTTQALIGAI